MRKIFFMQLLASLLFLSKCFAEEAVDAVVDENTSSAVQVSTNLFNGAKHLLVLQVGSDWCESGDYVKRIFESEEFRRAFNGRFEFAIYDDMDFPTPEVKARNEQLAGYFVPSKRFPAITCVSANPRRVFGQIENIPWNITQRELLLKISRCYKAKKEADIYFEKAKGQTDAALAADSYGKAFELLCAQVGELNERYLTTGGLAYTNEWDAVLKLDAEGKFGVKGRLELGDGFDVVKKATEYRVRGDLVNGAKFIASLRIIPSEKLTVVQQQAIDMAEYALWRRDESKLAQNSALLHKVFKLNRDTVWGQCALGRLFLNGEQVESRPLPSPELLRRPNAVHTRAAKFPLESIKTRLSHRKYTKNLSESDKTAVVTYAVLRRIGEKGWEELYNRPGSRKFINDFFGDRTWMEDFLWSGHCTNWKDALLALESAVFHDGRRWYKGANGTARRFMTALALEHFNKDESFLADMVDAYRSTAMAKRLHKHALKQSVYQWRLALSSTHRITFPHGVDAKYDYEKAAGAQQRFLDGFANVSVKRYVEAPWLERVSDVNCLGENINAQTYYELWTIAGDWIPRRYISILGGSNIENSMFAVACANAHGLAACTVSQPKHRAFTVRRPDGHWHIGNSLAYGTILNVNRLPCTITPVFSYTEAHEGTYEGEREDRLNAERYLEIASIAETEGETPDKVLQIYQKANESCPTHYAAWQATCLWIRKMKMPISEHRTFIDNCVKSLQYWREPLWLIVSRYLGRVKAERGDSEYAEEIIRILPMLKQGGRDLEEESLFYNTLNGWAAQLVTEPRLRERVLMAAIESQKGTQDFFSQTLELAAGFMAGDEGRMMRFSNKVKTLVAEGDSKVVINFGRMLRSASDQNNVVAFQIFAGLQEKLAPLKFPGASFPLSDFGGDLVSKDALLRVSNHHPVSIPARLPYGVNASPLNTYAFHTHRSTSPWAMVVLDSPCLLNGIVVVNKVGGTGVKLRQVPIEIQVSADGSLWRTVYEDAAVRDVYRVNVTGKVPYAKFVRVRRTPEVKNDYFHLNKILVYGKKLAQ